MARWLFVGGTRFIGHAAVLRAQERGHHVTLVHRGQTPCGLLNVAERLLDGSDAEALRRLVRTEAPDCIIDTRAMCRRDGEVISQVADDASASLVVLSSADVYAQFGRLNGLPMTEPLEELVTESSPLTIPRPFQALGFEHEGGPDYDKKDVESELALRAERSPTASTVVLRLPGVVGARDPKRRFGGIVDAIDRGARTFLASEMGARRLSHVHVADVAEAVCLAAERAPSGLRIFNVAEPSTPSMADRVHLFAKLMNVEVTIENLPPGQELEPELALFSPLPNDLVLSTRAIREELGFTERHTPEQAASDVLHALRTSRSS